MTGGHYTSYVRAVPCSADGVEEVASSFPGEDGGDYRWLHVDDDVVEEAGPKSVVTDAAYVLFYRRRRLTPSTVISLSASGGQASRDRSNRRPWATFLRVRLKYRAV